MRFLLILLFLGVFSLASASIDSLPLHYYWVYFRDKVSWKERITQPHTFLSLQAIQRRIQSKVLIDTLDLPIASSYLKPFEQNKKIQILGSSKWLNLLLVKTSLSQEILSQMPGVKRVERLILRSSYHKASENTQKVKSQFRSSYGLAQTQVELIPGLTDLHLAEKTGKGIIVAIFDSGFIGVPSNPAFAVALNEGRILGTRNFVNASQDVFSEDDHGSEVFSVIGAYLPQKMVGTAYGASFYLAKTENPNSETRIEEFNWLRAAEWADSLGVHIISSSLNYNTFDNPQENYTYSDLDGKTSIISRAAAIAASKGILVVCSAGNYGARTWRYILPPCDADSILCVGGGRTDGSRWPSSSVGPTADNRIKPDVVALGQSCAIVTAQGNVTVGSGTSYAAPIISGMAACLWQAHPQALASQIRKAILTTASHANMPNFEIGYGWPNASRADSCLKAWSTTSQEPEILFFPNPTSQKGYFGLVGLGLNKYQLRLFEANGKEILHLKNLIANIQYSVPLPSTPGIYYLEATWQKGKVTKKIWIQ
ncbi:MAG: S8 family serine peptidase [Bacteroidia bacterium]|nr:S8 family serine peptidase [Bacteroidia bacterium]MDW8158444.1 S8 family serine peptidase [Bacteroidia bacterium]